MFWTAESSNDLSPLILLLKKLENKIYFFFLGPLGFGVLSVLSLCAAVGENGVKVSSLGLVAFSVLAFISSSVLRLIVLGLLLVGKFRFLVRSSFLSFSFGTSSFFSSGSTSPSLRLSFPN